MKKFRGILSFFDEAFAAFWTGDRDLSFTTGDAHNLLTLRAFIIPVIAILDSVNHLEIFPILQVALISVFRKHAEKREEPKRPYENADDAAAQEKIYKAKGDIGIENGEVQLVDSVASLKNLIQPGLDFLHHIETA